LSLAGMTACSVISFDGLFSSSDCNDVLDEFKQRFNGHLVEYEFPIQNKKTTETYGFKNSFCLMNMKIGTKKINN